MGRHKLHRSSRRDAGHPEAVEHADRDERAVKKHQLKATAELMGRTLHGLDELGIPYAVVLDGIDQIFTNTTHGAAIGIMEYQVALQMKIREEIMDAKAEKIADQMGYGGDEK